MKHCWILLSYLCAAIPPLWADAVELKYEDLPRLVAERNRNIQGTETLTDAARTRTGYLRRSFGPSVRVEAGQETFTTGPYDAASQPYGAAEAQFNLYRGGRDRLEEKTRWAQVEASSASARRVYLDELAQARRLYWALVYDRELVGFLSQALDRNEKILSAANRRISRGLATETDRLEFEMFALQLREEAESLRHDILLVETAMAPLVNWPAGTVFHTEETLPHPHDDALLLADVNPEADPRVTALLANQNASLWQGQATGRMWAPSLDLYGGYHLYTRRERDFPRREDRDDTVGGVRLSWALLDGLQTRKQAAALAKQAQAYGTQADYQKQSLGAQAGVVKENLKHHHELLHSSEKQMELAQKYLTGTLDEYDRGVKNSPDVLGALQKYVALKRQYAERRREYQSVRAELMALFGL